LISKNFDVMKKMFINIPTMKHWLEMYKESLFCNITSIPTAVCYRDEMPIVAKKINKKITSGI